MIEKSIKNLSVEEIMQKIKDEINKRKGLDHDKGLKKISIVNKNTENFIYKDMYEYEDFTKYNGEEFIRNVYRGILKREPDIKGFKHYFNLLKSGKKSKMEIVSLVRFSEEGKRKNVNLLGARKRYIITKLFSVPLMGNILKSIYYFYRLPQRTIQSEFNICAIDKNHLILLERFETEINIIIDEIDKINNTFNSFKEDILQKLNEITDELKEKANQQDIENLNNTFNSFKEDILQKLNEITDELKEKANQTQFDLYLRTVNYAKDYMQLVQQNIQGLVDEAKKRLPNEVFNKKELLKITKEEKHKFDTFYVEFEDKFRGSREDIKQRVSVYLSYLGKLPFEKEKINILDIGCGRGEWLELLKENGYNAKGIDINRIMVAKCKELGLNAEEADAIEYLSKLDDESLNAITGFHIIEHLPFEALMKLFEESYRVLKKGGMVIFETPNPENIIVGACNFYTDPTHRNPLVPESVKFILENIGFAGEIKRLHPFNNIHFEDSFINHVFTVGQDYAIIGYKK